MRPLLVGLVALLALLALSTPTAAQTTYRADWYLAGATSPVVTGSVLGDSSNCAPGSLPPVPGTVTNPTQLSLEHDSDGNGTVDICTFPIGTFVTPLGMGTYFAKARATNVAGTTADSAGSNPFSIVLAPAGVGAVVIH